MSKVFEVNGVTKSFGRGKNQKIALSNIDLEVTANRTLGIVGESGSGKSTLARCLVGLMQPNSGSVSYRENDMAHFTRHQFRDFRREVQMVFQDPYSSLNPRMRVRDIVAEGPLIFKLGSNKNEIREIAEAALTQVGIKGDQFERYPRQFSGGQRQRISIARALAVSPKVLICDEPVSSLDVSIQAQILNLLKELNKSLNLTMIFISHDLGVIRYIAEDCVVMQHGQVVEQGSTQALFENPQCEYTQILLNSVPIPDPKFRKQRSQS